MDITLDKIDELRARVNVSYEEACNYLRAAGGDLIQAIVMAERDRFDDTELTNKGRDTVERIRTMISESAKKRLVVRRDERTVAEIPLVAGVVGAVLAPKLAVLGAVAALVTRSTVKIED